MQEPATVGKRRTFSVSAAALDTGRGGVVPSAALRASAASEAADVRVADRQAQRVGRVACPAAPAVPAGA